ncbi:hypothetical protein A5695_05980 [Mycobacterium sp. E1747]|nr:hypothetical protein A5695_05980 [Mycobacterium sp. E1747]
MPKVSVLTHERGRVSMVSTATLLHRPVQSAKRIWLRHQYIPAGAQKMAALEASQGVRKVGGSRRLWSMALGALVTVLRE